MFSENTFQLLYNITFLKSVFWKTLFKNGAEEFNLPKAASVILPGPVLPEPVLPGPALPGPVLPGTCFAWACFAWACFAWLEMFSIKTIQQYLSVKITGSKSSDENAI